MDAISSEERRPGTETRSSRSQKRDTDASNGKHRFTRAEYYKMGELGFFDGERVELLRGDIVKMSPKGVRHTSSAQGVVDALRAIFPRGHVVRQEQPLAVSDGSEPEPDVAVVRGQRRDFEEEHPHTAELVVEVAETSLQRDRVTKAPIYAEAGVREYWILDIPKRLLEVYRDPKHLGDDFGFGQLLVLREDETVSPLAAPEAVIRIADLLPSP